jgi:hypothetical protein
MSLLLLMDIQIDVKIRFESYLLEYLRDSRFIYPLIQLAVLNFIN